jgi:hypothetical protein
VQKISRAAIAVLAVVSLAACSTDDSSEAVGTSTPSLSASAEPSATAEPSEGGSDVYVYALPAGVIAGTNEAIAWEALMSPVGEYAAAAMYQAVIDEFGPVEPYVTIKAAEERHISALIRQLDRYGVDVPANPYLGVVAAPADLTSAAKAWAVGEIENVDMYDNLLGKSSDSNLERVLTNLRASSQDSHLPLFEAAAENGGTLTVDQMMAIQAG